MIDLPVLDDGLDIARSRLLELLERENPEPGCLYIVGTPIGNRGDISPRALGILAKVDRIAAEDTRHSGELLSYYGIRGHYLSFHMHNSQERKHELVRDLKACLSIALISDAGMPTISDPGKELVDLCLTENVPVRVVPGPSAGVSALALSGLAAENFRFCGFLPVKGKERRLELQSLAEYPGTSLLYEAPHRLLKTLADLEEAGLAGRTIAACRELTKQYEEVRRGTVQEVRRYFEEESPRGEFVLVLEGKPVSEESEEQELRQEIRAMLAKDATTKDILFALEAQTALSKNALKKLIQEERESK